MPVREELNVLAIWIVSLQIDFDGKEREMRLKIRFCFVII